MIEQKKSVALKRLNALMAAGYLIDEKTSQESQDEIWLYHPSKNKLKESELILFGDGLLRSTSREVFGHVLTLHPHQEVHFAEFLQHVSAIK